MNTITIDGILYADMLKGGAALLRKNETIVNDLNVFPIPDGDTGSNMLMTLEGGIRTLSGEEPVIGNVAKRLSGGMLMGARGNSGVILSQFFGGINKGLAAYGSVGSKELAAAFEEGVRQAYGAVVTPTEGTILTVAREASRKAADYGSNSSVEDFFDTFLAEARESLKRTPDLLPCLKEAGVIDSGGAGLIYIIEGMSKVLRGEELDAGIAPTSASPSSAPAEIDFGADSRMEFGYCTEFILQLMNYKTNVEAFDIKELISYLGSVGDSIVAVKNDSIVKVHVHTMTPGKVFDHCQQYGEFVTVKVENMTIQHSETTIQNNYEEPKRPAKRHGLVAVTTGEGLKEAFLSFGCDRIVEGGQTMNPSTEDFVAAFDAINAENIYVLPNNSNVIMAAKQAAEIYKKSRVFVVETKTVAEGYVAMTMLDLDSDDPDVIAGILSDAAQTVTTGLISRAVRDAEYEGVTVREGDYIGISGKRILCAAETPGEAACRMLALSDKTDKEVVIAICGKDCTKEDLAAVEGYVKTNLRSMEFFSMDGGQDVYELILAIE